MTSRQNGVEILLPAARHLSLPLGGSNSVVESQPSKLLVAGSIPVSRSKKSSGSWLVASKD